jgi:hypothetical protein
MTQQSKAEYVAKLNSLRFGAGAKPQIKVVDGVERRSTIDENGKVGTIHTHKMGTEIVGAHAFIHEPVKVLPKSETS